MPLHAKEQEFGQISRVEACRLDTLRVLYHGYDRHEYHYTHDEGAVTAYLFSVVTLALIYSVMDTPSFQPVAVTTSSASTYCY